MASSRTITTSRRAKHVLQLAGQLLDGRLGEVGAGADVMAKKRGMTRRPKRRPTPRPKFKPLWSEEEGLRAANNRLALDGVESVATRLAAMVLARTPEQLMRGALEQGDGGTMPAEVVLKLFGEAEGLLKARLEVLGAARTRVLWAAAYAHGV
jgi:hypothetical protein